MRHYAKDVQKRIVSSYLDDTQLCKMQNLISWFDPISELVVLAVTRCLCSK